MIKTSMVIGIALVNINLATYADIIAHNKFSCDSHNARLEIVISASFADTHAFPKILAGFKDINGNWHERPSQNLRGNSQGYPYTFKISNYNGPQITRYNILVLDAHYTNRLVNNGLYI